MVITPTNSTSPILIAPCRINCRLCRAHTRDTNTCPICGAMLCMHKPQCLTYGYTWLNEKWLQT